MKDRAKARRDLPETVDLDPEQSGRASAAADTPPSTESRDEAPPPEIGPYKIIGLLGEGGMGAVYLAHQEEPVRRRVALKLLHGSMATKSVLARFDSERQALALMDHPNIARVFDGGTTPGGRPFFVMEHVPGQPITDYCDRNHLGTDERLRLFLKVCAGVQHAHQKGVIHRDLKPTNILVTPGDGDGAPKIIDFGVAKAIEKPLTDMTVDTVLGQLMGTPAYMSPEQTGGGIQGVDTRTDIYTLGVILYELLVGALPIEPEEGVTVNLQDVLRRIREEEPSKPSTRIGQIGAEAARVAERRQTDLRGLGRRLRGDLDWIVLKALEKDPARRYASASEFAADIERHLRHEPVVAGPPGTAYRLRKFLRKHRAAASVASVFGVGLLVAFGVITWLLFQVSAESDASEASREAAVEAQGLAEEQRRIATSRELAAISAAQIPVDPELSLLLAIEAHEISPTAQAEDALREALLGFHLLTRMKGHDRPVTSIGFSPDGRRVISGSQDGTARVWDAATGEEQLVLGGHARWVTTAIFDPAGTRIATADGGGTIRIWNAATGDRERLLDAGGIWTWEVRFDPDGKRIAATSAETGLVRIYDVQTGELLTTFRCPFFAIEMVRWSPDGRRVAAGGRMDVNQSGQEGPRVGVWDAATGELVREFPLEQSWVRDLDFSPDGRRVAVGSSNRPMYSRYRGDQIQGSARVYDVESGRLLLDLVGHDFWVIDVEFSPDGSLICTTGQTDGTRVWNAGTGEPLFHLAGHEKWVYRGSFTPDGEWIVSSSADGTTRIWDSTTGREVASIRGVEAEVFQCRYGESDQVLATGSPDGSVNVWDLREARRTAVMKGGDLALWGARFDPGGERIVTASRDHSVRVLEVATGRQLRELYPQSYWEVTEAILLADGRRLVSGGGTGEVNVWDLEEDRLLVNMEPHRARIRSVDVGPDEARLVAASEDGVVRLSEIATGVSLLTIDAHEGPVYEAVFDATGQRLATAGADGTVRIWDAHDGAEARVLRGHEGAVHGVGFHPDGRRLISAGRDGTARIWSIVEGKSEAVLRGHLDALVTARFSPDGALALTSSVDRTARLWDGKTGAPISIVRGHDAPLTDASFHPAGAHILTAARDGRVRVAPVEVYGPVDEIIAIARGRVTRELTPDERTRFLPAYDPRPESEEADGAR